MCFCFRCNLLQRQKLARKNRHLHVRFLSLFAHEQKQFSLFVKRFFRRRETRLQRDVLTRDAREFRTVRRLLVFHLRFVEVRRKPVSDDPADRNQTYRKHQLFRQPAEKTPDRAEHSEQETHSNLIRS